MNIKKEPLRIFETSNKEEKSFSPVHPQVGNYILNLASVYDHPVLLEMEALAKERDFPIVGRQVGPFLHLLALSIGAKRIFEFGSGYGYSAYWFARALEGVSGGKVICTEGDEKNVMLAKDFLSRAGLWEKMEYHAEWAQEVFKKTEGEFDIIYNDVDKGDYPEVWKMARTRIRKGGLYIADNTLWSGRVTMTNINDDVRPGWTAAIHEHNKLVVSDPDFDFFLNPARDGVMVARRK
jgi:predicted O-methyltransferase YrrM